MSKIGEIVIEESNLLRDIYKESEAEWLNCPDIKNKATMFMRAFIAGARSETAKEYWKFKLTPENNVEDNDKQ